MYEDSVVSQGDSIVTEDLSVSGLPEPVKLASVNHLALDAIAAAITGAPFYDVEFAVPLKGRDQMLYANSDVIKRSCPVLWKSRCTSGFAR